MSAVNKIDSNNTGLRFAEELTIGVLPGSPVWNPLEPNSYSDFGGNVSLTARNPINDSRQLSKGVATDVEAAAGFDSDVTQKNLQELMQGFFYADFRRKGEEVVTAVDLAIGVDDEYDVAATAGFLVGSIIQGQNFTNAANNTVNTVTTLSTNVFVGVADGVLVAEASPPSDAQIVVVGFESATGDVDVDASGTLPTLTSTILDFTTLGLIPGEWIFIGGDVSTSKFTTVANNGFARIRSIAANVLTIDKSVATMVTEANTTADIKLFFGRVLKNEAAASIVRRTYNLERTLGAPDSAIPANIQAEYVEGATPNQLTISMPTADKVTASLSFVGTATSTVDGPTALKSGTRPAVDPADAFNTSSDFSRIKMSTVSSSNENVTALFAFVTELSLSINNNVVPDKAVSVLGAFDMTAGSFEVGGSITAYFADVAAIESIKANADVTLDLHMVRNNSGVSIDLPLLALGDGRAKVEQDKAVTLPITMSAARGRSVDANLDHTLLMVFFDYLPNAA